jgi:paraquat-inducible protein B
MRLDNLKATLESIEQAVDSLKHMCPPDQDPESWLSKDLQKTFRALEQARDALQKTLAVRQDWPDPEP